MTVSRLIFDAAAAVAILFGGLMVVTKNAVRSVLTLVVAFFALAVCYVMLLSPFIAAVQVIVYAGAILVLFLFVLMLLNIGHIPAGASRPFQTLLGSIAVVLFAALLLGTLRGSGAQIAPPSMLPSTGERSSRNDSTTAPSSGSGRRSVGTPTARLPSRYCSACETALSPVSPIV